MREKLSGIARNKICIFVAGCIVGALIIVGIRLSTYEPPKEVHYHANFAVYLNGQQEQFKGQQYYEEVEMCNVKGAKPPLTRAHMHDNVNNVVHVEDDAVTWGHFFANLGWTLGPTSIQSRDGTLYAEDAQNKMHIMINGQDYTDFGGIANRLIEDKDKLLISYGTVTNDQLSQEYKSIPGTAEKYDSTKDPASCSGEEAPGTFNDRLKHIF